MATRSTNAKPTVRFMVDGSGMEYKVTLMERIVVIRPKGARRDAEVALPISTIYQRGLIARVEQTAPKRKRKVKRGLLSI